MLGRYLGASLIGNLAWEGLQLPLYTLWTTVTAGQWGFAVLHCTIGDVLIAATSLGLAVAIVAREGGR